ncbi:MAG: LysE family transporter [Burkholderiales bacterium]|nr:LysE family transporter [Burkholderiales bacterium]
MIGIIAGIGPQNLYIISHAIKQENSLIISITCCVADIILFLIGCAGLSLFNSRAIVLTINIIGIIFISWYLMGKVRDLFRHHTKIKVTTVKQTQVQAIIKALALTWLNPLVLIDMVVLIAGTATRYAGYARIDFMLGAIAGDILWIFGITLLATRLSNKLNRVEVWICLDILTILIMLFILYTTVSYVIYQ